MWDRGHYSTRQNWHTDRLKYSHKRDNRAFKQLIYQ